MDLSESRQLALADAHLPVPASQTLVFFSVEGLPERAGKAFLQFGNETVPVPRRVGPTIFFPSTKGRLVIHMLRGGRQFLAHIGVGWYFGGTDDDQSIFLSEVERKAGEAFETGGEAGFYESLKPEALKRFEKENPDCEIRRQGDIFAAWSPAFGKSPNFVLTTFLNRKDIPLDRDFKIDYGEIGVLDTRHFVKGGKITITCAGENRNKPRPRSELYFGELNAPDHPPLDLGLRPHLVYQTAHLVHNDYDRRGD